MFHSVHSPYRSRHTRRLALHLRLGRLREVMFAMPAPQQGWLREMRRAIGWDLAEVSARLGMVPSSLSRLETSERRGSIRLENLRRAADALGCELVYVLLPRDPRVLTNRVQLRMRTEAVFRRAAARRRALPAPHAVHAPPGLPARPGVPSTQQCVPPTRLGPVRSQHHAAPVTTHPRDLP